MVVNWSGYGWIEIVGLVPRTYPRVVDNRASPDADGYIRYHGCVTHSGTRISDTDCPSEVEGHSQAFWTYVDFDIIYGQGGAVSAVGSGPVILRDCVLSDNLAGEGSAVHAVSIPSVEMTNTSFVSSADIDPFSLFGGVDVLDCVEMPCQPGESCTYRDWSRFCERCGLNEHGDGYSCTTCPQGTQPDAEQVSCVLCPANFVSSLGICQMCTPGTTSSADRRSCVPCGRGTTSEPGSPCAPCPNGTISDLGSACERCPAGLQPTTDAGACETCAPGTFSVGFGCEPCEAGSEANDDQIGCTACLVLGANLFSPPAGSACEACPIGRAPGDNRTDCAKCPQCHGQCSAGALGCQACPPGTQPSDDASRCDDCPSGTFSFGTGCQACSAGFESDDGRTSCQSCFVAGPDFFSATSGDQCTECPALMRANGNKTGCVCKANTYDVFKFGPLQCDGVDSTAMGELQCMPCLSCLECSEQGGALVLKPGYALYGQRTTFACPVSDGCIGATVLNLTSARLAWVAKDDSYFDEKTMKKQCARGYAGPVCGKCDRGYNHLRVGKPAPAPAPAVGSAVPLDDLVP